MDRDDELDDEVTLPSDTKNPSHSQHRTFDSRRSGRDGEQLDELAADDDMEEDRRTPLDAKENTSGSQLGKVESDEDAEDAAAGEASPRHDVDIGDDDATPTEPRPRAEDALGRGNGADDDLAAAVPHSSRGAKEEDIMAVELEDLDDDLDDDKDDNIDDDREDEQAAASSPHAFDTPKTHVDAAHDHVLDAADAVDAAHDDILDAAEDDDADAVDVGVDNAREDSKRGDSNKEGSTDGEAAETDAIDATDPPQAALAVDDEVAASEDVLRESIPEPRDNDEDAPSHAPSHGGEVVAKSSDAVHAAEPAAWDEGVAEGAAEREERADAVDECVDEDMNDMDEGEDNGEDKGEEDGKEEGDEGDEDVEEAQEIADVEEALGKVSAALAEMSETLAEVQESVAVTQSADAAQESEIHATLEEDVQADRNEPEDVDVDGRNYDADDTLVNDDTNNNNDNDEADLKPHHPVDNESHTAVHVSPHIAVNQHEEDIHKPVDHPPAFQLPSPPRSPLPVLPRPHNAAASESSKKTQNSQLAVPKATSLSTFTTEATDEFKQHDEKVENPSELDRKAPSPPDSSGNRPTAAEHDKPQPSPPTAAAPPRPILKNTAAPLPLQWYSPSLTPPSSSASSSTASSSATPSTAALLLPAPPQQPGLPVPPPAAALQEEFAVSYLLLHAQSAIAKEMSRFCTHQCRKSIVHEDAASTRMKGKANPSVNHAAAGGNARTRSHKPGNPAPNAHDNDGHASPAQGMFSARDFVCMCMQWGLASETEAVSSPHSAHNSANADLESGKTSQQSTSNNTAQTTPRLAAQNAPSAKVPASKRGKEQEKPKNAVGNSIKPRNFVFLVPEIVDIAVSSASVYCNNGVHVPNSMQYISSYYLTSNGGKEIIADHPTQNSDTNTKTAPSKKTPQPQPTSDTAPAVPAPSLSTFLLSAADACAALHKLAQLSASFALAQSASSSAPAAAPSVTGTATASAAAAGAVSPQTAGNVYLTCAAAAELKAKRDAARAKARAAKEQGNAAEASVHENQSRKQSLSQKESEFPGYPSLPAHAPVIYRELWHILFSFAEIRPESEFSEIRIPEQYVPTQDDTAVNSPQSPSGIANPGKSASPRRAPMDQKSILISVARVQQQQAPTLARRISTETAAASIDGDASQAAAAAAAGDVELDSDGLPRRTGGGGAEVSSLSYLRNFLRQKSDDTPTIPAKGLEKHHPEKSSAGEKNPGDAPETSSTPNKATNGADVAAASSTPRFNPYSPRNRVNALLMQAIEEDKTPIYIPASAVSSAPQTSGKNPTNIPSGIPRAAPRERNGSVDDRSNIDGAVSANVTKSARTESTSMKNRKIDGRGKNDAGDSVTVDENGVVLTKEYMMQQIREEALLERELGAVESQLASKRHVIEEITGVPLTSSLTAISPNGKNMGAKRTANSYSARNVNYPKNTNNPDINKNPSSPQLSPLTKKKENPADNTKATRDPAAPLSPMLPPLIATPTAAPTHASPVKDQKIPGGSRIPAPQSGSPPARRVVVKLGGKKPAPAVLEPL